MILSSVYVSTEIDCYCEHYIQTRKYYSLSDLFEDDRLIDNLEKNDVIAVYHNDTTFIINMRRVKHTTVNNMKIEICLDGEIIIITKDLIQITPS